MTPAIGPLVMTGRAIGAICGLVAVFGCVQAGVGAVLLRRFVRGAARRRHTDVPVVPVTVLKPLHGDEPMLEQALDSFCRQDHPDFQIVFGVQDPEDPAIAVVRRLQQRFPQLQLDLVVSTQQHGPNRKIGNLINMLSSARHDILVMSDSDIHAEPNYLRAVSTALHRPGVGLVTTLYGGIPADGSLARRLAAAQVNHNFLPGVLMSRLLGRQDCLGATMALRRETLEAVGGLAVLSPHLADDSALGQAVRATGAAIAIADTMTRTTVSDAALGAMYAHELRWGRTVRSVEPVGYALSAIQLPLFWASLAVLAAPAAGWSWGVLIGVWLWRAATARMIDGVVRSQPTLSGALLPLRDWISALVMVNSFRGGTVAWRGHVISVPARSRIAARAASKSVAAPTIVTDALAGSPIVSAGQQPAHTQPQTVE
ncbi:bacteriohopanetetrol glucosamine biosynthesis glycosyltransferase HpnI [Acetobacteraceae bacterium KSS8]|uniref:Bacteriohopanetetrol glucosamine biosynthesis glycosyltransferase HpnI n=1 Tax=Endosaccharibacter trunci TaxID=2812733 RepID=A0ABT1WAJ8_9PROT|nr:bacteriohopanetetrol glucosamine biosynthesis glycosyltransferase HpnI [Acetobacteraceae bacterium KSS8]